MFSSRLCKLLNGYTWYFEIRPRPAKYKVWDLGGNLLPCPKHLLAMDSTFEGSGLGRSEYAAKSKRLIKIIDDIRALG